MVQDQINRIQAARLAMAEDNSYSSAVNDLEVQLRRLELGGKEVARQGWEYLKRKRRG